MSMGVVGVAVGYVEKLFEAVKGLTPSTNNPEGMSLSTDGSTAGIAGWNGVADSITLAVRDANGIFQNTVLTAYAWAICAATKRVFTVTSSGITIYFHNGISWVTEQAIAGNTFHGISCDEAGTRFIFSEPWYNADRGRFWVYVRNTSTNVWTAELTYNPPGIWGVGLSVAMTYDGALIAVEAEEYWSPYTRRILYITRSGSSWGTPYIGPAPPNQTIREGEEDPLETTPPEVASRCSRPYPENRSAVFIGKTTYSPRTPSPGWWKEVVIYKNTGNWDVFQYIPLTIYSEDVLYVTGTPKGDGLFILTETRVYLYVKNSLNLFTYWKPIRPDGLASGMGIAAVAPSHYGAGVSNTGLLIGIVGATYTETKYQILE